MDNNVCSELEESKRIEEQIQIPKEESFTLPLTNTSFEIDY